MVAHLIRAICAILRGCAEVRQMFADNIGYRVICEGVKHSGVFTDEVLTEFIHLATEQSGPTVHYTQVGWWPHHNEWCLLCTYVRVYSGYWGACRAEYMKCNEYL